MRNLLTKINEQYMVFSAYAWMQVENNHCQAGTEAAAKSRTAAIRLGQLMEEWGNLSVSKQLDINQGDNP